MSDFGSGLEVCGPMHEKSGRASKADLRRRIAELETEVERLKVCGNCGHLDWERVYFCSAPGKKGSWGEETYPFNHCHFRDSRWLPCDAVS